MVYRPITKGDCRILPCTKTGMRGIKKLLSPLLLVRGQLVFLVLRGVRRGFSASIIAISLKHVINYLENKQRDASLLRIGILAIALLVGAGLSYPTRIISTKIFRTMQTILYERYLNRFFRMDNNISDRLGTGKTNNILQKGIDNRVSLNQRFPQNATEIVLAIITSFATIFIDIGWIGTVGMISIIALSFWINQRGNKQVAHLRKEKRDISTTSDRAIVRMIMSKTEIIQNKKEQYETGILADMIQEAYAYDKKIETARIWSFDVQRASFALIQVLLVAWVGRGIYQGRYSLGTLGLVWMLTNNINSRIMELNDFITHYHQTIIFVEKLRDTFDGTTEILGYSNGLPFMPHTGKVMFDHVSYSYTEDQQEVIHDFSCVLEGGTKTAFVGMSGSGKSTIIKLIAGYLHPTTGKILIDGQALPHHTGTPDTYVSLESYYPHIGYLTQEPNVFDGTIRENISYGVTYDMTDAQLRTILYDAQCHFVFDFVHGIDTEIGEKGIRLSGGQRQRLAIAKVMIKNPRIVLLDEPTSALDSFSEEEVTKALDALFAHRTVVIIAHRLQTVKKATTIFVIDQGVIKETGTHEQLVAAQGQYAKMLSLQSGF